MSEKDQTRANGSAGTENTTPPVPLRKRILLVEDEPLTRLILLSKLRLAGFDVDVAWNGTLALEKLRAHRPDAMFLDLMLPDIKGVDLIKEVRADKIFSNRPIYVCTSAALMSIWTRRAMRAGATKVFNKGGTPVNEIVAEVTDDLLGGISRISGPSPVQAPSEASNKVRESVSKLCVDVEQIAKCDDDEIRAAKCGELRAKVQGVLVSAGEAGMHQLARMAAALEAFLKEICEKAKKVTDSSLTAIYAAVEVMGQVCHGDGPSSEAEPPGYTAVVVDNDLVSRTAVGNALRNAGLKPVTFGNPVQAVEYLKSNPADLVIVDASVSAQSGLDLRNQVGEVEGHKNTPVFVVASPRTVKRATRAASKNATEFVAKPYTPMELSLKALSTVLRNRTQSKSAAAPTAASSTSSKPAGASNSTQKAAGLSPNQPATEAKTPPQVADFPEIVFKKASSPQPESGQPSGAGARADGDEVTIEFNDAFKIVSASETCLTVFGWETQELVGRDLASVLKGGLNNDLGHFVQQGDAVVRGSSRPSVNAIVLRKDGSEFSSIATLAPLLQGSQVSWTASFRAAPPATSLTAAAFRNAVAPSPGSPVELPHSPGQSAALADALRRLQHSQAALQSANEELHRQFEAISGQANAQREEIERKERERGELVARIYSNEVEINRVKTTLEKETEERKKSEELLSDLTTAKAELEKQLAAETKSKGDLVEAQRQFQSQISDAKQEAERAKTELEKQAEILKQKEAEWQEQSAAGKAAIEKAEAARAEESDRAKRLEEELTVIAKLRDELNAKLETEQKSTAELKTQNDALAEKLRESADALNRARHELSKQAEDRGSQEAGLREQLNAATSAAEKAEAARKEEAGRCVRLETELAAVHQVRDELSRKGASEQRATSAAQQRVEELERNLREREAELERVKTEHTQRTAQSNQLETVLAGLREERDDLHRRYTGEQQAGAKAKQRVKELEKQLRESAAGFTTAKTELDKRAAERERLENELQAEVTAAKATAEKADQAKQEEAARCRKLEEQLTTLRQEQDDLNGKLSTGQRAAEEAASRIEDLEKRLLESAAELGRAKAAAESQTTLLGRTTSAADDFGQELCRLRENEAAHLAELSELERRVRDSVASLARVTAELEKERAERRRVEQRSAALGVQMQELHVELKQHLESEKATQSRLRDLEQELHERGEVMNRVSAELHKETADRQLAEEQLRAAGDMSAQLRKYLSLFDESKKVFKRAQEDLETKLQASHAAVSEVEAKLQKEVAERQRLEETLQAAQRSSQEDSEKTSIELAKLQTALQVEQFERQRVQGDAIQSRFASLDSTRAGRAHVVSFCRQIHQPVETVMQSTRRLLETDLSEPQKKLVEAVLENALVVQTNLNESGSLASASARGNGDAQPVAVDAPRAPGRTEEKPAGNLQP